MAKQARYRIAIEDTTTGEITYSWQTNPCVVDESTGTIYAIKVIDGALRIEEVEA